ncbi:uncharacterized protein DUF4190 [Microcella alkaliphila]|jgi:hypothetical protein|uniref:Uncharacterized protein DUF4190 n=1 Tax=Microcella alkaliphila TaxID=279828 RepID=A0A4Q7TDB7_9MICO|nr:DUF4190 domain-containing protein [Microcella alkaliphila]RZT58375.1 uncharacterized protein DUF4190 [Microcella alkaliphila]
MATTTPPASPDEPVEPAADVTPEPAAGNPYAPPPAAPAAGPAYGGAPAAPKQTLSIVSLVTGISGVVLSFFFGLGLLPAVAGVVTGHMALKREPHARGLALGGLITSYVGLALSILIGLLLLIPVLFFFIGLGALGTAGSF